MPNTGIEPVIFACHQGDDTSATHYHCANQASLMFKRVRILHDRGVRVSSVLLDLGG